MSNPSLSIRVNDPEKQLYALKQSRLAALVKDPEIFNRMAEAAVQLLTSEKLRGCDEESILGALYKAATLGFRLEPEFGECYLIPRNVKDGQEWKAVCCFQIGYKGWRAKALESGHVLFMGARAVYKEDSFSYEYGTASFLKHVPSPETTGETSHFYAFAKLASGYEIFDVIGKQAAEKSRRNSESEYDWHGKQKVFSENPKGFWLKGYTAMACRVPIKNLCAMLPITASLELANMADNSVTYLQKDGTLTTISGQELDKISEQIEPEPLTIDPKIAEKYLEAKDALDSMTEPTRVLEYYHNISKTSLSKSEAFVTLFFNASARTSKTIEELAAFHAAAKDWQRNTTLVSILSKRKKEIEHELSNV